ncbi:hypothetical protein FGO68_gene3091 [Halteria grandinella]|uniref:Uncharacterized protein n=1 Tax=Halteria grandinella TaxID=5974 RepID=A0A8J8P2D1_HALGN|nr:hypothetical protein FGO68_gene3091 [Halteria grandinella]
MVKKYRRLTDEERHNLVVLIHQEGYTIKEASRKLNIPYPNAKAVNQTYLLENRTAKKNFRFRLKYADFNSEVQRRKLQEEFMGVDELEIMRRTCGVHKIRKTIVKEIRHFESQLKLKTNEFRECSLARIMGVPAAPAIVNGTKRYRVEPMPGSSLCNREENAFKQLQDLPNQTGQTYEKSNALKSEEESNTSSSPGIRINQSHSAFTNLVHGRDAPQFSLNQEARMNCTSVPAQYIKMQSPGVSTPQGLAVTQILSQDNPDQVIEMVSTQQQPQPCNQMESKHTTLPQQMKAFHVIQRPQPIMRLASNAPSAFIGSEGQFAEYKRSELLSKYSHQDPINDINSGFRPAEYTKGTMVIGCSNYPSGGLGSNLNANLSVTSSISKNKYFINCGTAAQESFTSLNNMQLRALPLENKQQYWTPQILASINSSQIYTASHPKVISQNIERLQVQGAQDQSQSRAFHINRSLSDPDRITSMPPQIGGDSVDRKLLLHALTAAGASAPHIGQPQSNKLNSQHNSPHTTQATTSFTASVANKVLSGLPCETGHQSFSSSQNRRTSSMSSGGCLQLQCD